MLVCSFSRFAFLPCKRHPSGCRAGESGIAERLCLYSRYYVFLPLLPSNSGGIMEEDEDFGDAIL